MQRIRYDNLTRRGEMILWTVIEHSRRQNFVIGTIIKLDRLETIDLIFLALILLPSIYNCSN